MSHLTNQTTFLCKMRPARRARWPKNNWRQRNTKICKQLAVAFRSDQQKFGWQITTLHRIKMLHTKLKLWIS